MITEKKIDWQSSLEWIHDNTPDIAMAKGKMSLLDNQLKAVKADLILRSEEKSFNMKEQWAYAHAEYKEHLFKLSKAIQEYTDLNLEKDYHFALVEAWRSWNASQRAVSTGIR